MIHEAILCAALAASPMFHMGNHHLTEDDGRAFKALIEPVKRGGMSDPPIVFIYNYFALAKQLRGLGVRAYSVTIGINSGHLRALLSGFPFRRGSLGAVVVLQKVPYSDLFEAIEAVGMSGIFVIDEKNLPYLGEVILTGMGFHKTIMSWHDRAIFRRHQMKSMALGDGFEVFNAKRVMAPALINRSGRGQHYAKGLIESAA